MSLEDLPDLLRHAALEQAGISRHRLEVLLRMGVYEQIAPGSFIRTGAVDDTEAALMSIAARRPDATLCLLSALAIHDLTDEIPAATDVALPRGSHRLTVQHAPIAWHFFDQRTFGIGREEHSLTDDRSIGLYSPERTLVDVFRLRHTWGTDLATGALKRWLRRPESSTGVLMEMARKFPAARPALQATLEVLQ